MMSSSTEKGFEDGFLRECRTGWLLVADDFGGKLNEKESLRHGMSKHLSHVRSEIAINLESTILFLLI